MKSPLGIFDTEKIPQVDPSSAVFAAVSVLQTGGFVLEDASAVPWQDKST